MEISQTNLKRANFFQTAGFTFLEIMVALSILSIVIISISKLHIQTIAMNNDARFFIYAPLLGNKVMAEIDAASLNDLSDDSGDFGEEFPGYTWSVSFDDVESENLESVAESIKKIDVTVSFNENEYNYNFTTYRFYRE